MTRQVYERTVHVWAIPHVITVHQKSEAVWLAVLVITGASGSRSKDRVPMLQPNGSRRLALGTLN